MGMDKVKEKKVIRVLKDLVNVAKDHEVSEAGFEAHARDIVSKLFEPPDERMAHMKEFPSGFISGKWTILKKFWKDVESETESAKNKFLLMGAHLENDPHSMAYWLSIVGEEFGKLQRSHNKLSIASTPEIEEKWRVEGYYRIITTVSLLRRLAENWDELDREQK